MSNEEIKTLIKEYYSNIDEDSCSMFELNMKNSILNTKGELKPFISEKVLGTALYAIFHCVNETRRIEAKKKLAQLNTLNEFFGSVGDKFKSKPVHLHLIKTSSFETQFGFTFIWNMRDDDGRTFVWFSSSSPFDSVNSVRERIFKSLRDDYVMEYHKNRGKEVCESDNEEFVKLWNENKRLYKIEQALYKLPQSK